MNADNEWRHTFRLVHSEARRRCAEYAMQAPEGTVVRFAPPSKSREQEEKYHAMISDIAHQCQHLNKSFDAETWKRLLVDQFKRETLTDEILGPYWSSHKLDIIPSLDRSALVVLGEQTRKFPKYVAAAFIEWLYAWGAGTDVQWTD